MEDTGEEAEPAPSSGDDGERSTVAIIADTSGTLLAAVAQIDRLSAREAVWKAESACRVRRSHVHSGNSTPTCALTR